MVFERRHVIGGAAVTEEIIPGFKFSRASYLLSLLRPQIYTDLELKKHGLRLHLRNPYSFTPMLEEGTGGKVPRSLLLGTDMAENQKQIAQFSRKDAQAVPWEPSCPSITRSSQLQVPRCWISGLSPSL